MIAGDSQEAKRFIPMCLEVLKDEDNIYRIPGKNFLLQGRAARHSEILSEKLSRIVFKNRPRVILPNGKTGS